MGIGTDGAKPFTENDILNRELILRVLKYEDELYLSEQGQTIMRDVCKNNIFSLDGGKTIQRMTLQYFGYSSTLEDLKHYRTIFHHYYNSPKDYDKEILASVFYMRENRLLYYTTPKLEVGDNAINTELLELELEGQNIDNATTLFDVMLEYPNKKHIICAFSLS